MRSFQDAYGLDADGKAGPNTLDKIDELVAEIDKMREEPS